MFHLICALFCNLLFYHIRNFSHLRMAFDRVDFVERSFSSINLEYFYLLRFNREFNFYLFIVNQCQE